MVVLFSPVGNSDPWRSGRDGAMLHIVRHFKPKKVVLFFTETLWLGKSEFKGHKEYEWEEIIQQVSVDTEVEVIVDTIEHPQDFDVYKEKFHEYIKSLGDEYPEDEILLNVTSGTPQMEATLCLEYVVYPHRKKCIQVSTPENWSNANLSHSTPKEELDAVNIETVNLNEEAHEPRYKEIEIISFREAMVKSQILGLIANYDYEGALSLIQQQEVFKNKDILLELLTEITSSIKKHSVFKDISEKYSNDDLRKLLFHYLILKLKFDRGDIAEVLIRVKSIAEYIAEYYINTKYPDVIVYNYDRPQLNQKSSFRVKYEVYLNSINKKLRKFDTLGLPAYIDILACIEGNSSVSNKLNDVMKINKHRNSVAHKLDTININNNNQIRKAVKAIEKLIIDIFKEVDIRDFEYVKQANDKIREFI
ncbi:CRISPR-associated protein Csm6 [Staphylococcus microti]|uniref:CRISPR-associated protein Csm6 n=1 Tax=Staphylococcus microti TaxID=569857 RepID=A0A0D6XRH5_9STAP|nr:type III-A CRISPR-associated CARF protein Csm6 [Staphylococcus microti]KIX91212.1 CRISPR-associated protein Csm6 [Staphylococcus microti]PNZ79921.1 type III-A CRISPR-associated protein Csm6 [Staphylococcus microti]SUM56463.1 CRISPR-associated protein, Csm6 family [Staphylococcus microti]